MRSRSHQTRAPDEATGAAWFVVQSALSGTAETVVDIESPVPLRVGPLYRGGWPTSPSRRRAPYLSDYRRAKRHVPLCCLISRSVCALETSSDGARNVKSSTKNDRCAVDGELATLLRRETNLKDGNWVGEPFEIERSP
jgi:hypothetical protein